MGLAINRHSEGLVNIRDADLGSTTFFALIAVPVTLLTLVAWWFGSRKLRSQMTKRIGDYADSIK